MREPLTLGVVLFPLAFAACTHVQSERRVEAVATTGPYADRALALERADAARDVEAAVSRGDFRFLGVNGAGYAVPGVSGELARRHGSRAIPGTTDALTDASHAKYQAAARAYAERYNRALLGRIAR